jgi:hypothetical protein
MRSPDSWSPIENDGSPRWSWHVIERFLKCPRLFELEVVQNLAPVRYNSNLSIGTAFHVALAHVLLELRKAQREVGGVFVVDAAWCDYLAGIADKTLREYTGDLMEADRWTALRAVRAYCVGGLNGTEGGPQDFSAWEILHVEETLRCDLSVLLSAEEHKRLGPIMWSQTPDVCVKIGEGYAHAGSGIWAVDHKTMSRPSSLQSSYRRDGQAMLVTAVMRFFASGTRGFLVNGVTKAQEPAFCKAGIEFTEELLRNVVRQIYRWKRQIQAMLDVGMFGWPENWASCVGKYGYCDFYDYCHEGYTEGFLPRTEIKPGDVLKALNEGWTVEGL